MYEKVIPFTKLQIEEICHRIDVRQETIDEDPSSADNFESKEGSLNNLKLKILSKSIGWSNMHSEGPTKVNGYINSMENAISKSKSTLTK